MFCDIVFVVFLEWYFLIIRGDHRIIGFTLNCDVMLTTESPEPIIYPRYEFYLSLIVELFYADKKATWRISDL